jgi:hypothetical protein
MLSDLKYHQKAAVKSTQLAGRDRPASSIVMIVVIQQNQRNRISPNDRDVEVKYPKTSEKYTGTRLFLKQALLLPRQPNE